MKGFKCAIFALLLLMAATCSGYITQLEDWYFANSGFSAPTITDYIYFTPTTAPTTAAKGKLYYNAVSDNLYICLDGTNWTLVDTAGGTSLDASYDLGNGITVDGTAVTLTVGAAVNNSALAIVHGETTNNNDAFTIAHSGSGDAIQITVAEADGVAQRSIAAASQTTSLAVFDAATSNWDGADDIGMIHITCDDPLVDNGASLFAIVNSGQPKDGAEGWAMRIVDTGTKRAGSHAMEVETTVGSPTLKLNNKLTIAGADEAGILVDIDGIDTTGNTDTVTINHSGTGDGLQVTCTEADSVAANFVAAASQTTSVVKIDGATSNWDGADNVGMLHIATDDPVVSAGASLLHVAQTGTPIAAAEGFLARFRMEGGTAVTDAYAVEIETVKTTPCLKTNNLTTMLGADETGTLLAITGNDATGNSDTVDLHGEGTGSVLKITCDDVDSVGMTAVARASQITPVVIIDGATNNFDGADNKGQLTLTQDDAVVHKGATQLMVHNTGTTIAQAEGFLARFVQDTGAAVTDAYAVEIETTDTTPALYLNNQMSIVGQATGGVLMDVTSVDVDNDTVQFTGAGSADVLQITSNATTSQGLNVLGKANATATLATFDGDTGDWIGDADDVAMVEIIGGATANAHVGGGLFAVIGGAQPKANSEGYLARFIATGTAQTNATAVEIEVPATQPALAINGITKINGQDAAGATLFQVAGVGADGDADAMLISNTGAGHCLQITPGETDSGGINLTGLAASTVPMVILDGTTNDWDGADNKGQLTLLQDTAFADAGATQLMVHNTGTTVAAAEGFLARFVHDTGAAVTDAYAVEIEVVATTGAFKADGHCLIDDDLAVTGALYNPITAGTKVEYGTPITIVFKPDEAATLQYTVPTGYDLVVTDAYGYKTVGNGAHNDDELTIQNNGGNPIFTKKELFDGGAVNDGVRIAFTGLDDAENELEATETLDLVALENAAGGCDSIITVCGFLKTAD